MEYYHSKRWGRLVFIQAAGNSVKPKDTCQKCLLRGQPECIEAPCAENVREDGKNGYFIRHEMPNGNN